MTLVHPALVMLLAAITGDTCPEGSQVDPAKKALVQSLLASTADGARLSKTTVPPSVCFAEGEGGLLEGVAILPRNAPREAQAARLAHLWQHTIDHAPTTQASPEQTCVEWLTENERAEQRGDAVEARVASTLHIAPLPRATRHYACR